MAIGLKWLLCLCLALCLTVSAAAADKTSHVTADSIAHAISSLKSNGQLDKAVRQQALARYQEAQSALDAAADRREKLQKLKQKATFAPRTVAQLQGQLASVEQQVTQRDADGMTREELSDRIKKLEGRIAELQSKLGNLQSELTRIAQRPSEAREELASAREALRRLKTQTKVIQKQPDVLADAQKAKITARKTALNAKIELLKQELSTLDAREQILEARTALVRRQLETVRKSLSVARSEFSRRQTEIASELREDTKNQVQQLTDVADVVSHAAARNAELASRLVEMSRHSQAMTQARSRLSDRIEDLERHFNLVQRQLQIGGGSAALADVLRDQKRKLAEAEEATLAILEDLPDLATLELQAFQLQQKRMQLEDVQKVADALIEQAGVTLDEKARKALVKILEKRRNLVTRVVTAYNRFVKLGHDLQAMSRQYKHTVNSFTSLMEERLFWLPSFAPVDPGWVPRLLSAFPAFFKPAHWGHALLALGQSIRQWMWVAAAGLLVFVVLMGSRGVLRRRLRHAAEPVGNVRHDSFWVTLRVMVDTVLFCLPWPLLLALTGWLIRRGPQTPVFVVSIGVALVQLATLLLIIKLFREVCRPFGLAQVHFQWPGFGRRRLRRSLRVLLFALILPVLFVAVTETINNDMLRETIGRAAFMFGSLALAWFAWHVLHPNRGVLSDVFGPEERGRWLLGYIWMPLVVGIALVLAGLAAWGYYYTASQLESRFFLSAGLLGASIIVYNLIIRGVTVTERRMALTRALRKREEAREVRATREAAAVAGEGKPDTLDEVGIDMVQVNEQTRALLRAAVGLAAGVGLWFLWIDLLPALSQFNTIGLWQNIVSVDGESQVRTITLGALLLALAVGVFTALAGRNLPGFLEIAVLRRFSSEPGSRYAIAKLFQYAIVVAGLMVSVSLIGVSWTSIQWLVAALGVGLGFGLQEIFANFVSGLVILFERPVRVGDTVSVGTLTGTVSRVRIRATTVTDWDNKEVIIPNKTFVTETVINWTLTDAITRLIVRVSVDRNTDTDLAQRLITEAIEAEPSALEQPAPSVFIVSFEEGQIVYEARVFFHDLYYLLPLQHALYRGIKAKFVEHDIEIAFPQKELHLRSVDESVGDMFSARANEPKGE